LAFGASRRTGSVAERGASVLPRPRSSTTRWASRWPPP